MKPFNRLSNKIKSTRGASITYALLIMLLGALVSAVVVASAYSASRAAAKDFDQQQEFLLVDSAVKLFKDQIESTGADTAGELRYKTTQVITYNGATEDTGVATTGALTESWPESDAANKKWITPLMVAAINALKTQDTFTHDKIEIDYTEIITKATFEMKKTANGIDYPITMTITTDSDNSTTPYVVLVFYGHKKETITDTTNGQNKLVRTISTLYWWTLESARTN